MTTDEFKQMENYMLENMCDSAHDKDHIYRVLYVALDIARYEADVDYDVLITACLLHDIGRADQFKDPTLCHAKVGAKKAFQFLISNGYSEDFAHKVKACIRAHRFRANHPPITLEEKILFDADKVDVTGSIGIARTLFYKGQVGEPLYTINDDGEVSDGSDDPRPSFFQEYKYKLEDIYNRFYTRRGKEIAAQRQHAAVDFYNAMLRETGESYHNGIGLLDKIIQ